MAVQAQPAGCGWDQSPVDLAGLDLCHGIAHDLQRGGEGLVCGRHDRHPAVLLNLQAAKCVTS